MNIRENDIQFPETQINYAKKAIGNETFAVNKYNSTAEIFGIELAQRGLNMRHYSVIITDNKDDYTTYSGPRCTRDQNATFLHIQI
uniref:Uncharacterized protein n=1 Tax=Meloidogyne incognita TaxID=6306 RepID=A0A914M9H0_MELIC